MDDTDYTPEQQQAIDAWLTDGFEPPEMTAEEADIENITAVVESAVASAAELISAVDELTGSKLIKNRTALHDLRHALEDFLDEFDPEPSEWGEP
jgi:hypothetical protein